MRRSVLDHFLFNNFEMAISRGLFETSELADILMLPDDAVRQQARLSHFVQYHRHENNGLGIISVRKEVLSRHVFQATGLEYKPPKPPESVAVSASPTISASAITEDIKAAKILVDGAIGLLSELSGRSSLDEVRQKLQDAQSSLAEAHKLVETSK
jgi:hypothetical protein